jgi:cytochrome c-type biogenesis protein CcmH
MGRSRSIGLLVLFVLLISGAVVSAQEPEGAVSDDDVNRVARELYCPICENTPLDVCETQACEDWRELIREKLAAGQSDQEIINYFAEIYGERARATPATRGISLVVWVLPVIGVIVGGFYFVRLLQRWLARGTTANSETVPISTSGPQDEMADYVTRLEREIHESS